MVLCHPHFTHDATSNAQPWVEQRCQGITEYNSNTRVLVNVWAHRLCLVTTLQSWHRIGCHLHLLSRVCLCTVEATVATCNCEVERQVLNTWYGAVWGRDEKHWLINTRENTVWNCPSAAMPLQINSLGSAEVKLITVLACVWLIGQWCERKAAVQIWSHHKIIQAHLHIWISADSCAGRMLSYDIQIVRMVERRNSMKEKWRFGPQCSPARPCKHESM